MKIITTAIVILCLASPALSGGKIQRACNKSDRNPSSSTCRCIQKVANKELTRSDQKLAAKFFKDPQLAQDTRQSSNASKERFWKRYKKFGATAQNTCG